MRPMSHRVTLTLLALTCSMGLVVGCASAGADENYKLLQEDRNMFDTRPDPDKPGAMRPAAVHDITLTAEGYAPPQENAAPAAPTAAPASQTTEDATALPQPDSTLNHGVARSVTSLDRSHWQQVTVGADLSGSYRNSYFKDISTTTQPQRKDIVTEPARFVWGVVTLPVKLVKSPPWKDTVSQADAYSITSQPLPSCCQNDPTVDDTAESSCCVSHAPAASNDATSLTTSKAKGPASDASCCQK